MLKAVTGVLPNKFYVIEGWVDFWKFSISELKPLYLPLAVSLIVDPVKHEIKNDYK